MDARNSKLHFFPITPKVRAAVFAEWRNKCAYCRPGVAECVDHIYPRSRGGPDALENYAASCTHCNMLKGDLVLGEGIVDIVRLRAAKKALRIAERLAKRPVSNHVRKYRKEFKQVTRNLVYVDMHHAVRREMMGHFSQGMPVSGPNRWGLHEISKVSIDCYRFPDFLRWLKTEGEISVYVRGEIGKSGFISKIVTDRCIAVIDFHPWLLDLLKASDKFDAECLGYRLPQVADGPKDWEYFSVGANEFFPERLARLRVKTVHV